MIFVSLQSVFESALIHPILEDLNFLIEVSKVIFFGLRLTVLTFVHLKDLLHTQYKMSFLYIIYIIFTREEVVFHFAVLFLLLFHVAQEHKYYNRRLDWRLVRNEKIIL